MARPSPPVRYLVLIAAIVCLLCAVCARTQKPAQTTATPPQTNPSAAAPDAGAPPQTQEKHFFPGTKAPARIYSE